MNKILRNRLRGSKNNRYWDSYHINSEVASEFFPYLYDDHYKVKDPNFEYQVGDYYRIINGPLRGCIVRIVDKHHFDVRVTYECAKYKISCNIVSKSKHKSNKYAKYIDIYLIPGYKANMLVPLSEAF